MSAPENYSLHDLVARSIKGLFDHIRNYTIAGAVLIGASILMDYESYFLGGMAMSVSTFLLVINLYDGFYKLHHWFENECNFSDVWNYLISYIYIGGVLLFCLFLADAVLTMQTGK